MSWKDFLSIAVAASPYIAAPFTGGASLSMAPYAAAGAGAIRGSEGGWKGALMGGTMGLASGATAGAGTSPLATGEQLAGLGAGTLDAAKAQGVGGGVWQRFLANKGLEAASKMASAASAQMGKDRQYAESMQGDSLRNLQTAEYLASGGDNNTGYMGAIQPGTVREAAALRDKLRKQLQRNTTPNALETVFDVAGPALGMWESFVRR